MKCMMSVDGSNIVRVSDDKASNLYHEGCKNTIKTTTDGEPPIEWTDSNPNVLVVDPGGNTELDVV